MNIEDLVGQFQILGSNQDDAKKTYKGTLDLNLDAKNRIVAKWMINKSQEQYGTGFFRDNILVLNFNYQGDENTIYKGVAVYRCISNLPAPRYIVQHQRKKYLQKHLQAQ